MEHLILILCLSFVFAIVTGMHLYTMKKINDVQKNLMIDGKDWRALERASAGSLYTLLMLFLFSTAVGVILHKFVMVVLYQMYLYAVFN